MVEDHPDKLPCDLEGDDLCWVNAFLTCPPCKWYDEQCWDSFENYAMEESDHFDEMMCEYMDWPCFEAFAEGHPDIMPCEEDDMDCWFDFIEEYPPCEEDDGDCWMSFFDYFFPQEGNDECQKGPDGACDYMDWECRDAFVMKAIMEHPEELPCELGDEDCWVEVFLYCPPCEWEDDYCWKSFDARYGVSEQMEKKKDGKKKVEEIKGEKGDGKGPKGDGSGDGHTDHEPLDKAHPAFLAKISLRA